MKAFVKKLMICFYRILNVILPKSSRMVVFSTSNGKAAGGNPRAIYEYAVRDIAQKGLKMKLVWFLTDELMAKHPEEAAKLLSTAENAGTYDLTSNDAPGNKEKHFNIKEMSVGIKRSNSRIGRTGSTRRIVRYHHPLYYWYMARAGAWIFDSRQEPYIVKRPGVRYLQTWHGTPLKKLGLDIDELNMAGENIDTAAYQEAFKREATQWDYLIAQNDFSVETFRRCFDFKGKMLKIGYPRNDVLVEAAREKIGVIVNNEKINETGETDKTDKTDKINKIDKNEKIDGTDKINKKRITLLYAPTWRDDKYLDGGWYAYSSPLDFKKLYELLGSGYRIVIKPHYLVKMRKGDIPADMIKNGFVKVCGHSEEINDLYLAADGLITDYSSAMFDYSLLGRPMFFFAYDMEEYANVLRGFYFDFKAEAPGPICRTVEELALNIGETFKGKGYTGQYRIKADKFAEKYNMYDRGDAARKAWEEIVKQ